MVALLFFERKEGVVSSELASFAFHCKSKCSRAVDTSHSCMKRGTLERKFAILDS